MNRTIKKEKSSKLSPTKLPKSFWDKVVKTTADMTNLFPSRPYLLTGNIPNEEWHEKKISYGQLRYFVYKMLTFIKDESALFDLLIYWFPKGWTWL